MAEMEEDAEDVLRAEEQAEVGYYEVLEVDRNASTEEITRAFHTLSRRYHPDRVPSHQQHTAAIKFKLVKQAEEVLKDRALREIYDVGGKDAVMEFMELRRAGPHAEVNPVDFLKKWAKKKAKDAEKYKKLKMTPKFVISPMGVGTNHFSEKKINDKHTMHLHLSASPNNYGIFPTLVTQLNEITKLATGFWLGPQGSFLRCYVTQRQKERSVYTKVLVGTNGQSFEIGTMQNMGLRTHATTSCSFGMESAFKFGFMRFFLSRGLFASAEIRLNNMNWNTLILGSDKSKRLYDRLGLAKYNILYGIRSFLGELDPVLDLTCKWYRPDMRQTWKFGTEMPLTRMGLSFVMGYQRQLTKKLSVGLKSEIDAVHGNHIVSPTIEYSGQRITVPLIMEDSVTLWGICSLFVLPYAALYLFSKLWLDPYEYLVRIRKGREKQRKEAQRIQQNKDRAHQAIQLMTHSVSSILDLESETNGLIIIMANYGAINYSRDELIQELRRAQLQDAMPRAKKNKEAQAQDTAEESEYYDSSDDEEEDEKEAQGTADKELPWTVNVVVPLQNMVVKGELLLPARSKTFLEGVYDPCPGVDKQLLVVYEFGSRIYAVVADDTSAVTCPSAAHLQAQSMSEFLTKVERGHPLGLIAT